VWQRAHCHFARISNSGPVQTGQIGRPVWPFPQWAGGTCPAVDGAGEFEEVLIVAIAAPHALVELTSRRNFASDWTNSPALPWEVSTPGRPAFQPDKPAAPIHKFTHQPRNCRQTKSVGDDGQQCLTDFISR
jgi:hypothetical protein